MAMKKTRLELSKEDLEKLRLDFQDNRPLGEEFADRMVNAMMVAHILGRTASSVRRWGGDPAAPLYPVLEKLYEGPKSPWVCTLGELWKLRPAIMRYRSGPKSNTTVPQMNME